MNLSALVELAERVIEIDTEYSISQHLNKLQKSIQQLAANPGDQNAQTNFASEKKELTNGIAHAEALLSPADLSRLDTLNGREFFTSEMLDKIERSVQDNPAAPAVIKSAVEAINLQRNQFLARIRALEDTLTALEFEAETVEDLEAQAGFTIPRSLFDNNLSGLISELQFVRTFVRHIAEVEGEEPDDISVGQISTTDPIFWLIAGYVVVSNIGKLTAWGLDRWKTVEEIRALRRDAAKNDSFTAEEIEKFFDKKIEDRLQKGIEDKAKEIAEKYTGPAPRQNELENAFGLLLKQFLARLERGMTVEIKLLAPPETEEDDDAEGVDADLEKREEMKALASRLAFPKPNGDPILQITNDDTESVAKKSKPKK